MKLFMKLIFFFILIVEVITMNSLSETLKGTTRYKLDNGMTVILEENSSSPVVAVNVWVGTGSACEEEGEYGLAHVHEHMLFKGTEKRKVGEIARLIEAGGGDINAFTSFDETVYYVVSASRFLNTTLDILSDVVQNSTFDPEELAKELEVVQEEIRRGEDSPSRVLSQKLFETAYDVHPYRRPVIGTKESVDSFTRKGIMDFYRKWYSPQNMILVVVGDFKTEEVKKTVEDTFGNLERRDIPECKLPEEPEQKGLKTFVIDRDINEAYFALSYHITSARHEDTPVIEVMSDILGSGESSRLYRQIKEEKGLVNNIYSYAFTPKDDGILVVGGTLDPENSAKAYDEILKQIARLKNQPVSEQELDRAKVNIESDSIYTKETMQGQARKLGFFELETGDYRYEQEYLDKVRAVTPEDIMRVAGKYLNVKNLTAGILYPSNNKILTDRQLAELVLESSENHRDVSGANAGESVSSEVKEYQLENGIKVLIKENRAVPIFAARAAFLGGVRYEDESTNGISNFLSGMFTRGTTTRSSEDIANEIESLAGEIDGFSGKNSLGVEVESLSRNFAKTMDIFSDVILNPSFKPDEIERERREVLSAISRQKDNLLRKTINLFLETLFTEHPYRFNELGTEENVSSFGRAELENFYNRVITPGNMVISLAGDIESEKALEIIREKFGKMKKGNFNPPVVKDERHADEIRKVVKQEKDKAQTHIILGYQAPDIHNDDKYAFEVMNNVLAGQGGRLFIELRDKQSLAYTVTSFESPGLETGYFGVYIGTSPGKEEEALQGIRDQLKQLLDKGVTDEELERAKSYIVGSFEIGLQKNSTQAAKILFDELYGLGWEEYRQYPQKIMAVTKQDVLNVARKYIDLDAYTLAIVKPE